MPRRSFDSIRKTTDLRFSPVYGTGKPLPLGLEDEKYYATLNSPFRGILGYTGHDRIRKATEKDLVPRPLSRILPGYSGYLPGVGAESVFGRTHGVVASACSIRR